MQRNTATCCRKAEFITNAKTAKRDKNGDDEASCDVWSNLQEKLKIKYTF